LLRFYDWLLDKTWIWCISGMILIGQNPSAERKACQVCVLSISCMDWPGIKHLCSERTCQIESPSLGERIGHQLNSMTNWSSAFLCHGFCSSVLIVVPITSVMCCWNCIHLCMCTKVSTQYNDVKCPQPCSIYQNVVYWGHL